MAGKTELVDAVAQQTGVSKADVGRVLDAVTQEIARAVDGGETVSLRGFGTFRMSERAARKGRNPRTGEAVRIAASKNLKFTAARSLKTSLNTKRLSKKVK